MPKHRVEPKTVSAMTTMIGKMRKMKPNFFFAWTIFFFEKFVSNNFLFPAKMILQLAQRLSKNLPDPYIYFFRFSIFKKREVISHFIFH